MEKSVVISLLLKRLVLVKGPKSKDCKYFYTFSLDSCAKSNKYSPCTNRPVKCELCNDLVIWSYNMAYHYEVKHPNALKPDYIIKSEIDAVKKLISN